MFPGLNKHAPEDLLSSIEKCSRKEECTLWIFYNGSSLDDIGAASLLFSYAYSKKARIVARSFPGELSVGKLKIAPADLVIVVGGLIRGELASAKSAGAYHVVQNYVPEHTGLVAPEDGGLESNSVWVYRLIDGYSTLSSAIRMLTGYYSLKCYMVAGKACEKEEKVLAAVEKEHPVRRVREALMLALRKGFPINLSLATTSFPPIENLHGNPGVARDVLVELGVCKKDSCPSLDQLEKDKEKLAIIEDIIRKISAEELLSLIKSFRHELILDAGWQSDILDVSLATEAYLLRKSPGETLSDMLSGYPTIASEGLKLLLEMPGFLQKTAFTIRKHGVKGRGLYAEPPDAKRISEIETVAKYMVRSDPGGDQLVCIRASSSVQGSVYIVGSSSREKLKALLSEAEALGAHYVLSGVVARLWVPAGSVSALRKLVA